MNTTFKIEKNVPLLKVPHKWADIADAMVEGDSVLLDGVVQVRGLVAALTRKYKRACVRKDPATQKHRVFCTHVDSDRI